MSETQQQKARTAQPVTRRGVLLEFFGSMNLAITILIMIAIASVIGTVLQQNQDYEKYITKFGPFWHEFFITLNLYDVYGAIWFLLLLLFLVITTSVCIYRNTPTMLHDMRNFRLNAQLKSLRNMENAQTRSVTQETQPLAQRISRLLQGNGYKVRQKQHDDRLVIAGMRGKYNRIGYILTHLGIVVICIGAFLDAKFDLTLREWTGSLKIDTGSRFVKDMPSESVLQPGEALSFRGSLPLSEGQKANFALLNIREGSVVQYLPFAIELKDFRVEQYETGAPKSFESDLVIHDKELDEPMEVTIAVNHPLNYRGYNIYQASFGDGGSKLKLKVWPFYDYKLRTLELEGEVFDSRSLSTMHGDLELEFVDFKKFNVFPAPEDDALKRKFVNYGASLVFRVRDNRGVAKEYLNYMSPVEQAGRYFFISGMRPSVAEEYRYIHIPADEKFTPERFMRLHALLNDTERAQAIANRTVSGALQDAPDADRYKSNVVNTMMELLDRFNAGGLDAIDAYVRESRVPDAEKPRMAEAYMKVLNTLMQAIYVEVLRDEGLDVSQGVTAAQEQFYVDALEALRQVYLYGTPFYVQLNDFEHVENSTLQITRSPGQNIVYLGCVMLIAGVFLLLYLTHQRIWAVFYRDENGTQTLLFAGSGNRNLADFRKHYQALTVKLDAVLET